MKKNLYFFTRQFPTLEGYEYTHWEGSNAKCLKAARAVATSRGHNTVGRLEGDTVVIISRKIENNLEVWR